MPSPRKKYPIKITPKISLADKRHEKIMLLIVQSLTDGRGDRIRTCDPLVPNQMRYQTAPLPVGYAAPGRTISNYIRSLS